MSRLLVVLRGEVFRQVDRRTAGPARARVTAQDPSEQLAALKSVERYVLAPARLAGWSPAVAADLVVAPQHREGLIMNMSHTFGQLVALRLKEGLATPTQLTYRLATHAAVGAQRDLRCVQLDGPADPACRPRVQDGATIAAIGSARWFKDRVRTLPNFGTLWCTHALQPHTHQRCDAPCCTQSCELSPDGFGNMGEDGPAALWRSARSGGPLCGGLRRRVDRLPARLQLDAGVEPVI